MIAPSLPMPQATTSVKPGIGEGGDNLRLNLGGRDKRIPGFLTVDLKDDPATDIVADCSDLREFKADSVHEIYASNLLEHFPHPKTSSVLREWKRVLTPKGILWISVPDFDAAVKLYQQFGFSDFIRNLLWGDQGYDLAYHYNAFTFASLAKECMNVGFSDIKRIDKMPFHLKDCSDLLDNFTHKSIMVNVRVTK